MVADDGFMVSAATLFPNLSFVHNWPQVDAAGTVVPFISVRQWQPVSPTETEVLSWFAVDREAPEAFKRDSYRAYLMCFGSSGMFEQDDVENWVSITKVSQGTMARRLRLNSRMGLTSDDEAINRPCSGFSGPGVGPRRLQRVQPAQLADDVVEPPRRRPDRAHPSAGTR